MYLVILIIFGLSHALGHRLGVGWAGLIALHIGVGLGSRGEMVKDVEAVLCVPTHGDLVVTEAVLAVTRGDHGVARLGRS